MKPRFFGFVLVLAAATPLFGVSNALRAEATSARQRPDGLYAEILTNKGLIVARLEPDKTPMTVASFVGLAEGTIDNEAFAPGRPYYDGSIFHRVVSGHVIQGGSPEPGAGAARGPGYSYPNEIHAELSHDHAGALGIANGGPHTNSSQFYITLADRSYLDGNYIVFGEVIEGMDVVHAIVKGDVIETVRIVRIGAAAENFRPDTASFRELVAAAEVRTQRNAADRIALEFRYVAENFETTFRTPSGIGYQVRRPGTGGALEDGAEIEVRYSAVALEYRGHILGYEGPIFEEVEFGSTANGEPDFVGAAETFAYIVGGSTVVAGVDEIIAGMRRGEQRLVVVPPDLAYGSNGFYAPNRPDTPRLVISPWTWIVYGIEIADD